MRSAMQRQHSLPNDTDASSAASVGLNWELGARVAKPTYLCIHYYLHLQ